MNRLAKSPLEVHFVCSTEAEQNAFVQKVKTDSIHLPKNTQYHLGYLSSGFVIEDAQIALVPMTELNHRFEAAAAKVAQHVSHTCLRLP